MIAFLLSKVGAYLVGGLLIATLAGGGYLYVSHLRTQNVLLTRQVAGYKRAMQIVKNDLKQDKETQSEKDKIDSLTPDQLGGEFDRLRQRAGKGDGTDSADADD